MGRAFLGEFEQRVMLAILRCDTKAYADLRFGKRGGLRASGHEPSRGAFYTTLDRLDAKGNSSAGPPIRAATQVAMDCRSACFSSHARWT